MKKQFFSTLVLIFFTAGLSTPQEVGILTDANTKNLFALNQTPVNETGIEEDISQFSSDGSIPGLREKAINILSDEIKEVEPGSKPQKDDSSIAGELIYFTGAAVVAALVYFLWPDKDDDPAAAEPTFGFPPAPQQ